MTARLHMAHKQFIMKPKLISPWFLLLLIAGLAACQNNGFSDQHEALQWFPNKVGDSWTYAVTDTAYGHRWGSDFRTGTLHISIIDSTKLPGGTSATVWRTVWPPEVSPARPPWNVDTAYVWTSGDTVKISYGVEPILFPPKSMRDIVITDIYIFPFQMGSGWRIQGPDTTQVVSKDSLSIPAGTFDNVYRINTHTFMGSFNYSINRDVWFKPGVGLVQKMVSFNGTYYTWKLVDYHVK